MGVRTTEKAKLVGFITAIPATVAVSAHCVDIGYGSLSFRCFRMSVVGLVRPMVWPSLPLPETSRDETKPRLQSWRQPIFAFEIRAFLLSGFWLLDTSCLESVWVGDGFGNIDFFSVQSVGCFVKPWHGCLPLPGIWLAGM